MMKTTMHVIPSERSESRDLLSQTGNTTGRARFLAALGMTALLTVTATAAHAQTIAIVGGRVLPVSGPAIDNGTVLIRDGKIAAVGANVAVPADAQRIDARGKTVTPGLIDAATELGVQEIGAVQTTDDYNARGRDSVYSAFKVWEGFNPASVLVTDARRGGVTTVLVGPRGGLVSGQAAMMELTVGAQDPKAMVLHGPAAMFAYYGPGEGVGVRSRGDVLNKLRALIADTRWYAAHRADYDRGATRPLAADQADLEAMLPVVQGREPLLVDADKASDILQMLDFANSNKIKLIIAGGAEAWEVAPQLAAAHVSVVTGAMNNIPHTFAELGARQDNVALLQKAGVPVALIGNAGGGDEEAFNVRNIRYEAGNAVAYGANWDNALRAITLTPAEIFGVADRVGSLSVGKDADVVVWSGDPFEFASQPEHVYVRGKEDTTPTRQDLLEQRYKNLPPNYRRP
ncbi:MAG TPA: amidohydrolase family protein [Gemmatimonadaceae bacterium]|nr:amidohydrolase family protein [Gemmatimonadaceae bacterium]